MWPPDPDRGARGDWLCLAQVARGPHCSLLSERRNEILAQRTAHWTLNFDFWLSRCCLTNAYICNWGGQFAPPPPVRNPHCLATAADRDTPFHEFFLSSLTHLLIPSLRKSDHRSRGHVTFCTRKSAQNLPKIRILHYVCNTWKLLIFLKCTNTVFILSLGPFAQFLISWNWWRSNYTKKIIKTMKYIRNKNNKIHKEIYKTIKYKGINLEFTDLTMPTCLQCFYKTFCQKLAFIYLICWKY